MNQIMGIGSPREIKKPNLGILSIRKAEKEGHER